MQKVWSEDGYGQLFQHQWEEGAGAWGVRWAAWGSTSTVVPWKEPALWGPRDLGSDSGSVTYGLGLSASHCHSESQFSHLSKPICRVTVNIKREKSL